MGRRHDEAAELERQLAELEAVRPFLDLAREIKDQVDRASAADGADVAALVAALEAVPSRERRRIGQATFDRLSPEAQWAVLERVFGDDEIREHLAAEHASRVEQVRRTAERHATVLAARAAGRLDLTALPETDELLLGLFVPESASIAVARGRAAAGCARRLVLRTTAAPGVLRVVQDLYDPDRGLFVTAAYDRAIWATERLEGHSRVRVGSLDPHDGVLEPVVYPGARVDVELDGEVREGRLHLGFAVLGDEDVFAATA